MLDGYTTSDNYPYSQAFTGSGGLNGSFNYVRNSVKATVDAYDGTIHFYVIDTKDPIIQAYEAAFPHLFTGYTKMPAAIKEHLRFPQDLFSAQTDVYRTYHMTNTTTFYNKADLWAVSPDPGSGEVAAPSIGDVQAPNTTNQPQAASSTGKRIDPIYLLVKLPGDTTEQFIILRPFVPVSKDNAQQPRLVHGREVRSRAVRQARGLHDAHRAEHRLRARAGRQHDPQHRDHLLAVHAVEPAGVARRPGQPPADPDRRLVALHPADLRRVREPEAPAFRFVVVFYAGPEP